MSLTLYFHPLSSYCHKVLIALYENETPFAPRSVNLGDPEDSAEMRALWPIGKFPVLKDDARGEVIPEATIIIEYLDQHYRGATRFLPEDPDLARQVRLKDRFFDNYLHSPMQKITLNAIFPGDDMGVAQAHAMIETALGMLEAEIGGKTWAVDETFSLADCAAGPPLFYINRFKPLAAKWPKASAYLDRLLARPSYGRALSEAEPFFHMLPI